MSKLKIVLDYNNNNNTVEIFINDKIITGITEFNLNFKENKIEFTGTRVKKDRSGQIIKKDDEIQKENINFLNYLNYKFENYELIKEYQQAIDWDLKNIYMTSLFNAKKYLKERGYLIE